jgi:hypothetical protein
MKIKAEIDPAGGPVQVRVEAGFAGVGKTVNAALFDAQGKNPKPRAVVDFGGGQSGIELPAAEAVAHIAYLQVNVASLVDGDELVGAIVRVKQDAAERAHGNTEPVVSGDAEVIKFKVLVELVAAQPGAPQ